MRISFDFRDLGLAELMLYGMIGTCIFFAYQSSIFFGRVAVIYLIFEITIRRFEIKVHKVGAKGK